MTAVVFAVAGPLATRSGGSIYNRRMIDALRARGWDVDVTALAGAFAAAVGSILRHPEERQRLTAGARARRATIPTWEAAGARAIEGIRAYA